MAADSDGVLYGSIVRPILAASYGSFNKNDIEELAKAIIKSEPDFLNHEELYESFYTSFAALAADYISSSASSICKSQLAAVCSACKILLHYLLSKLQSQTNLSTESINSSQTLSSKQLLLPIRALCSATNMLPRADQIALTAVMKNAKLPPHIKTTLPGEKEPVSKELKSRSRCELSALIMEQLTSPLHDFPSQRPVVTEPVDVKPSEGASSDSQDVENLFIQKNVSNLNSLRAGDIIIDLCLSLPHLTRYIHKYTAAVSKKGFSLPSTHAEALLVKHSLQALVTDIGMVWSAMSLPVLEPLTKPRLEKLCTLTMSCLYAALSTATAFSILGISSAVSPKTGTTTTGSSGTGTTSAGGTTTGKGAIEEEGGSESLAISVVEKALDVFNVVSNAIKNSTRAGGQIQQNHLAIGVWLLVSGLQSQLSQSSLLPSDKSVKEDKPGKSPSKSREGSSRINLMKVDSVDAVFGYSQQGFGVLSVALAQRALSMMASLLDDLHLESAEMSHDIEPAPLNIINPSTATQRAARVLNTTSLNQFLFYLATISYRKACTLKRIQKHPPEGDTFSTSDSTTYYDDDIISCSEESSPDEDDDSEPLLNLWFEETVSAPDCQGSGHSTQTGADAQDPNAKTNSAADNTSSIVPEKGEPNGYISLASQIFQFMNKYLICSESPYMRRYVEAGLAEQQMFILAAIIRDLDRESARTETGTISVYFGAQLGVLYCEFSQALTRYTHNLLAHNVLSEYLKSTLLHHLGVSPSPSAQENNNSWPLQVYPRTLAVLAQVLLLKPQAEKEAACINIWNRLIHTLVQNVCSTTQTVVDTENEADLNVEHAQLLLFLFHSLNLMQKKAVLLVCASGIIRVGETGIIRGLMRETQLLCLSRLLLLIDYIMKYLYDAPVSLVEQVQWNLFSATSMVPEGNDGRVASRMFNPWKDIEDNYRKLGPQDEFSMKPRFYNLTKFELNNQEQPKLDGLACNFILGTPDKVKYPLLMDALVEILNVTDQSSPCIKSSVMRSSFTSLCAAQYCFTICWRLLLQLPPSTPYLDKLALGSVESSSPSHSPILLHSLVWGPRAGHKTFISWMKDSLVKQGMYTQYAENLLKTVSEKVNNLKHDICIAKNTITSFTQQMDSDVWMVPRRKLPTLMELCLMDAVIAKVQVLSEDTALTSSDTPDVNKAMDICSEIGVQNELANELMPHVLRLTEVILTCSWSSLMYQINEGSEEGSEGNFSTRDFLAFRSVLAVCSSRNTKTQSLATALNNLLPSSVRSVLEKWNANNVSEFPWNTYANDIIPGESFILAVVNAHISSLSSQSVFTINPSLNHLLRSLITFISEHIMKCEHLKDQAVQVLVPLTLDVCTEYLYDMAIRTLERILGDPESDEHQDKVYRLVLDHIYTLLVYYADAALTSSDSHNEKVLQECLVWMESLLEKPVGRKALDHFFDNSGTQNHDLLLILLSIASPKTRGLAAYGTRVLQFFNKLFSIAEKNPGDEALERLCSSVLRLPSVEASKLSKWLHHVILSKETTSETTPTTAPSNVSLLPVCSSTGTTITTGTATSNTAMASTSSSVGTVSLSTTAESTTATISTSTSTSAAIVSVTPSVATNTSTSTTITSLSATNATVTAPIVATVVPTTTTTVATTTSTATSTSTTEKDTAVGEKEKQSANNVTTEQTKKTLQQENHQLLQYITSYIVKENSETHAKEAVAVTLLEALIPLGSQLLISSEGAGFPELMLIMATLADAGSGRGHMYLFCACTEWLEICKNYLCKKEVLTKLETNTGTANLMVESTCYMVNYVCDIVSALCPPSASGGRAASPPWDGETLPPPDPDTDWMDELGHEDDDESGGDDSDEDSLCNKLCTFTITQKEFMNQHWYHCHTCKMVDGVGVCTVCARVCHRGHDVTYAKYGNFFCDCGAKENGACQALVKRSPQAGASSSDQQQSTNQGTSGQVMPCSSSTEHMLTPSLRRRPSSPAALDKTNEQRSLPRDRHKQPALAKQLESFADVLTGLAWKEGQVTSRLIEVLKALIPAVEASCMRQSLVGCHQRAQAALAQLHSIEKTFESSDQLMVPTLGSQEGAFENVRMNYSGDQGQTIRQLLSAHMIRRVAMCCLASPYGKRQHLAVSHEKGKITVLQLSALLKQADSSKRKLTLTRLSSAPIPFTVLSVTGNPWNEDFLAVCGLKDCHVLTFNSSGSVSEHLVLHPQLETGNFIIRAIWLPGAQTQLALITADFVKIYDLSRDVLSPQYYFIVPTGKIRDVTFLSTQDEKTTMLVMSSTGYIYSQEMDEDSSAKHGPFYVTNTIDIFHPEIKDVSGQVCGGGVSVYYSHTLRLLFFSYVQGKSFLAPVSNLDSGLSPVFQITINRPGSGGGGNASSGTAGGGGGSSGGSGSCSGSGNKSNNTASNQPQPLCQWSEVPNHPGLVCSVMQSNNNPVILMVKPDCILVQEIKVVPVKTKIMDMVAIRHPSSNSDHRTTLILLCEDGSLRIYNASMEHTGFWLSLSVQAISTMSTAKPSRKKKTTKTGKPSGQVAFPVDFFEHSTLLNDIEFGGNDLLQIYNPQQIKHRLNTTGMYVVSTKTAGFSLELINNDATHVMTGIRVLLGNQDIQRVPSYIEVFGRSIQTTVARNRWFDLPLTREESLQADKKLIVIFGQSQDPDGVTMVDSVKVYGKSKDAFGWPEETEDVGNPTAVSTQPPSGSGANNATASGNSVENDAVSASPPPISSLERMVCGILEVLEHCFTLHSHSNTGVNADAHRSTAMNLATTLLTLPTPILLQIHTKSLLAALHSSRQAYHNYKDQALLNYVTSSLTSLRKITDSNDLDAEAFYRLVLMTRAIAVARPHSLAKISTDLNAQGSDHGQHLVHHLTEVLWRLHQIRPSNIALASVCIPGLTRVEATVHSVVEIVHAFTLVDQSENCISMASKLYLDLLLCQDTIVSFSAKQAFIRVLRPRLKRRRVFIPSPPHCTTPGPVEREREGPISQPSQDSSEAEPAQFEVDAVEPMVLLAPDAGGIASGVSVNVEALLGAGGFPPLLDIPPDADDETMVELAIALSLQDHEGAANLQGLVNLAGPALQGLAQVAQSQNQEAGHYSDTTASAGGSDDEGSTAATDGSTLRTSPAEQGGSESGGSGVDSITGEHNVSGRSSAYGDNIQEALVGTRSETSSLGAPIGFQSQEADGVEAEAEAEAEVEVETEAGNKLHTLRLAMLEKLIEHVPCLREVGGVRSIPYMQVLLMLSSDLDGDEERDRSCLESLLNAIIGELSMQQPDITNICQRTPQREVHLVIMRLLSVLMSRSKTSTKTQGPPDNSSFVSQTTANMLLQANLIDYCLVLLKELLEYYKNCSVEDSGNVIGGVLLKPHLPSSPPDMSPFFLRQYVKGHASDVFEAYPQLLTEMALRLPYQVQKHASTSINFEQAWFYNLCEYMMTQQTPFVRRQVRKLLLYICGDKDKYRQLRDLHSLKSHTKAVRECCGSGGISTGSLSYDALVELMEHLKACLEVTTTSGRTANWQMYCLEQDQTVLSFLLSVSCELEEVVAAQTILQLLQSAICPSSPENKKSESKNGSSGGTSSSNGSGSNKEKVEADKEQSNCQALVRQLNKTVDRELLTRFVRTFLLDTNATNIRWQAHGLILAIYKNSDPTQQGALLDMLWSLWPRLPTYGRKAAQFVDLLGYFSIKCTSASSKMSDYIEQAVSVLHAENELLAHHPNANLYTHLAQFVELDGFYLESEPCLVCNNPEVPYSSVKLSSIKIDSKFTTTTQIVKLVGSHMISKITLRIGDLKRTKMVRTINIFYNNRTVQAVVELKNKPAMWHKAKRVSLVQGQSEVKIEFPLPIVACNLMIEYADFYENLQASSESLQCPRCSASVPANPGVCANCGENVFQCHKCRAINYDEKDPFLCHACGFCKYAKFDYTLTARPCCAVDPIENDDDRKKTIAAINSHLEKADRVYKQLIGYKPLLEVLLLKINEHRVDRSGEEVAAGTNSTNSVTTSTQVNKAIQLLAQRYCGDCKSSFEELSRIIQRVLACRRELVAYDRSQIEAGGGGGGSGTWGRSSSGVNITSASAIASAPAPGHCYGCASSATEHCLTLLRALAHNAASRTSLCAQGLVQELVENNLRRGTVQVQEEVRQLLCLLTRDNPKAIESLCSLLMDRIALTLRGHVASCDLAFAVRPEMALLAALVQKEDTCWEQKLKCVMQLFLMACKDSKSPVVMESITLPCLKILQSLIKPDQPGSKKNKDKTLDALATIRPTEGVHVDARKWLVGDPQHSFAAWRQRMPSKPAEPPPAPASGQETPKKLTKEEIRLQYLSEKYGQRWRERTLQSTFQPLRLVDSAWLKQVLFNPSSRLARQVACNMLESLCQVPVRKREMLDLLTGFLDELGTAGESAAEFLSLYQSLVQQSPWKQYLALRGVLPHLADLLTREIQTLHVLEETSLTSDLVQGYALKMLTELMASFLEQESIKQQYKGRLVGAVLNGYLSLRRLVVQRTRLIDETQEKLLELLEEMTTGTEAETKAFMAICIETVEKCSLDDVRTPVFVFERLCSIIYPEENDVGEFYLTLEKDPQQEDFLQGRMLGNPYSCNEPGLGPLMRDVKNKICQDCELVALLEDDNGMELLVNNKIISLDLPVKEVYKKIWVQEGGEGDAMRVVYRMRGLLGDATEEFVETLHAKSEQEVNNEEVYKMANVMADCGGLQIMLERLRNMREIVRSRPLLQVILKLLRLCVKVQRNQEVLTKPELSAVSTLLNNLQLCLQTDSSSHLTVQLLEIMETVLSKAASQSPEEFSRFSQTLGGPEHVRSLLEMTASCPVVKSNPAVLHHLTKVLAALTYANPQKMAVLLDHFRPHTLDFNGFDKEHTPEDEQKLELFCNLAAGIDRTALGNTLKDYIVSLDIVEDALQYIRTHAPPVKPSLLRTDSDDWKDFISKPALKYILRLLTGLASKHEPTQKAVAADCIAIIHRLEQVSSDEHVGSLAENLLEALCTNASVATRIEEVREQTRAEKKRLAMAMREKQLGALGMRTNDKGQVTAESTIFQQMEELGEETGLVCVICREGYKFQPTKVLGIYTFTKRCNVDEFESKSRKTIGYSTVTHFNVVHIDCHMSAVRLARARDEWESAALQNANTKCNGLLPLWGPQVPESAFASCLARHNTYLQECTGHRDIGYVSTVHDLKLLLLRFAQEKSFHDDTGGGGPQSNMHIIPYLLHMALYVINTTRCGAREDKNLCSYLESSDMDKWVESCYEAEAPLYYATLSLLLHSPSRWEKSRIHHLRRLIVLAHARHTHPASAHKITDTAPKDYNVYKSSLVFFGLINAVYKYYFKKVSIASDDHWTTALADYIRHNDEALMKASEKLMAFYSQELLPCTSFEEFCDVTDLLEDVENPSLYIEDVLNI
ncbi:E3 ubiquitin-protein ligase-like protein poe isoform X3 [Lycorma delicatula]|uniref:E3 ubiquitin-protein ligase-like protein poe isoform X3 n=1 Tax=Lycorma delicatula TaxID=130591 RepID=UPI003F5171F1